LKFYQKIISKELFKITSLNSISVVLKFFVGFITSKFIALFVGPAGMALTGNLRNLLTSIENIGTLGFQNGIIKYVAEYRNDKLKLQQFLSTVIILISVVTILLSCALYFFSSYLNSLIFGINFHYEFIFKLFSVTLPFYLASIVLISILNGFSLYKKVIQVNICGNIVGLIFSVFLIYFYQTSGALIAILLAPSMMFFISLFMINREIKIKLKTFYFLYIKNLSEYTLMAFVSTVIGSFVLISIRNMIIQKLGYDKAGYYEAMSRISSFYLLFLSTILTVYFLPKLSKATTNKETKTIFWSYFKNIIPLFVFGLIIIFLLKDYIIPIIFSNKFLSISTLFLWQLVGDFFKALSLILGYQFFGKKLTTAFIITELFSLFVLYSSTLFLIPIYGIEGAVMAYAFTFFVYFIVLICYFRKIVFVP